MTDSSCDDIQEYLNIVQGNFPINESQNDDDSVSFGVSTAGAIAGDTYIYDNGLRWAQLVEEEENHWFIRNGFLEYSADTEEYISKHDMTSMIRSGDMVLFEEDASDDVLLEETLSLEDGKFDDFMNNVERYLLINEGRETFDFDYEWSDAWLEGKTPSESADEAILLEG